MAHVNLPNGVRVWINGYTTDTSMSALIGDLQNPHNYPEKRIKACRALASMGLLAKDAITALTTVADGGGDFLTINAALDALAIIDPENYSNMPRRKTKVDTTVTVPQPEEKVTEKNLATKVDIIQASAADDLVTRKCSFCEKETPIRQDNKAVLVKLSPKGKFYCDFCLRHNHNSRDARHIMIGSFRGIIGYFYYEFYAFPKKPVMWLSEINDYVDLHTEIGMRNPIFSYDPISMNWFIDFRRVGDSKKKIPIKDVNASVIQILAGFNLSQTVRGVQLHKLYGKFEEAVRDFHEKRYRPADKRICVPTLSGCGFPEWGGGLVVNPNTQNTNKLTLQDTRLFDPKLLLREKYWSKTAHIA